MPRYFTFFLHGVESDFCMSFLVNSSKFKLRTVDFAREWCLPLSMNLEVYPQANRLVTNLPILVEMFQ